MEDSKSVIDSRQRWMRFNIYLLVTGAFALLVNGLLPYTLKFIHECAAYIEVNLPILAAVFIVLGIVANLLYKGLTLLTARSSNARPYIQTLIFWALLAGVLWFMLSSIFLDILPILANDPEVFCD